MDSQEKEKQPAMDLPQVEGDISLDQIIEKQGSERNPELLPQTQGVDPTAQSQQVKDGSNTGHSNTTITNKSGNISSQSPAIADDVDLIEKEWVEKAKEIVNKTKDNPYLQNKAMSEFKADYIKKRYNKELAKIDE